MVLSLLPFSSFSSNLNIQDCKQYAIDAAIAESDYYGYTNFYDTFQAMLDYREMCEETGGNIESPVFL